MLAGEQTGAWQGYFPHPGSFFRSAGKLAVRVSLSSFCCRGNEGDLSRFCPLVLMAVVGGVLWPSQTLSKHRGFCLCGTTAFGSEFRINVHCKGFTDLPRCCQERCCIEVKNALRGEFFCVLFFFVVVSFFLLM